MSDHTFFAWLIALQVLFLGLDALDRYLPEHEPRPREPASAAAVGFIVAVLAVYFAIQFGLMALVPRPDSLVAHLTGSAGAGVMPAPGAIVVAVLAGLYLGGLADYLVHRFLSHSDWLFFTHEYHHLPREVFLLLPGLAARPFTVVATFPVNVATVAAAYGTLALLGQPLADLTVLKVLLLLQVFLLLTSHSSFLRRSWTFHVVLTRLGLTTPHEHLLHHTVELRGNFANLTTVWDRVLGTYLDPLDPAYKNLPLGLDHDQDWLGALTLGRWKLPESVRARFDVGRWCNLGDRP